MKIGGLQRVSLIDYIDEICAIVFTAGCNFRCPYCHNPELVTGNINTIEESDLFNFLVKRKGKLTAVSITGGEPTLHKDLPEFIKKIRDFGYKIKLDTNGTNPQMINKLLNNNLIDYIAMDIKAPIEKYEKVVDVKVNKEAIKESVEIIKSSNIDYEFRTTVVKELLSKEDILTIANMIKGAKAYCLQRFIPSKTLDENFLNKTPLSDKELKEVKNAIGNLFDTFLVR